MNFCSPITIHTQSAVEKAEKFFLQHNINTGVSSTAYLNAPVWIHCKCGSKASAKVNKVNEDFLVRGKCMSCKSDLQIEFKDTRQFKLTEEVIQKISPRAIPILLLLSRELGIGCYASGTGGSTGYSILGSLIFKELSIRMPLTVAWPSEDVYVGLGQSEALEHLQLKHVDDVLNYMRGIRNRRLSSEYENKATVNGKRSIDTPRKINRWGSFRINFIKGRTKKDTQNDQGGREG